MAARYEDGGYDSSNDVIYRKGGFGFHCHCAGEPSKATTFDPRGFILSGDSNQDDILSFNTSVQQSFVTVFQEELNFDGVTEDDFNRLFKIARNRLLSMESAPKVNCGSSRSLNDSYNSSFVIDHNKIRQELREFLIFLRVFFSIEGNQPENCWVIDQALPAIVKGLSLFRSQLGWLTKLPSYVWNNTLLKSSAKPSAQAAFHLFHCHLELRWLYIATLWSLASWDSRRKLEMSQPCEDLLKFSFTIDVQGLLSEAIKLCVVDLIEMSIAKFNKVNPDHIVQTSAFNCICVKELWLLLRFVTENTPCLETKSFWKVIDDLLEIFTQEENNLPKKDSRSLKVPSKIVCSDICALWLLRHIAEVFLYKSDGALLNPVQHEIESNYMTLKRVLNNLTGPSVRLNEPQRRVLVILVRSLMFEVWRPKPEPIMMLWESFYRTLDDTFQLPGAPTSAYVISSETILDIVNPLMEDKCSRNLNSYDMFLRMLGSYLHQDPKQWKSKMQGRFFSKLSEKKVNGLSELGLYHLTQLFLTIALRTDLEDLCSQFQKFVKLKESDDKRSLMVMKAHMCFVFLLAKNGKPLEPLVGPLTKCVHVCSMTRFSLVSKVFVENLEPIINAYEVVLPDLHGLVGEWIKEYLDKQENVRNLLQVMVIFMEKIEKDADSNIVGGAVGKLVSALCENLLPFVKESISTNLPQIADLAVNFTLSALEFNSYFPRQFAKQNSFENLLSYFLTNDYSNVIFMKRYLYLILSHNKVNTIVEMNDIQTLFIQVWVRCCTLECGNQDQDKCVMEKILPLLQNILQLPSSFLQLVQKSPDPVIDLFEFIGNNSRINIDKLLEPLKRVVSQIQLTLGLGRSKDAKWERAKLQLPDDMVVRAFYVLGKLAHDCASLIYQKNTSDSFISYIMEILIIPPVVFDMGKILPSCMSEGLRKSLPLFLRALHKLNPNKEKCIQRFLRNVIQCYVPRFRVNPPTDPFVKIWDQPEHMPAATQILETICDTLLQLDRRTNQPCLHYVQGLQLLCDLVKRNSNDDLLLTILITKALPKMLDNVGRLTDINASSKRKETEKAIHILFRAEAYLNPNIWKETNTVLSLLAEKYLGFDSEHMMRILIFLIKDFKEVVKRFLPLLKDHIKRVISKRGSGSDKSLEIKFLKLEKAANS